MQSANSSNQGLNLSDILFMLWQHKLKIIFFGLVGLGAAVGLKLSLPPSYQSQAKLMVRYVLERNLDSEVDSRIGFNDSVIRSEIEILTSLDLAKEVALALGPERIIPESDDPVTPEIAARVISKGLTATAAYESNIIHVTYTNSDPELATTVLRELVERYKAMHLEIHRSVGAFEFVAEQTDQMRNRLRQTDEELKRLKNEAGIAAVGTLDTLEPRRETLRKQLMDAQVQQAELQASVRELEIMAGVDPSEEVGNDAEAEDPKEPSTDQIVTYELLLEEIERLKKRDADLSSKFPPSNRILIKNRDALASLEQERRDMLVELPMLLSVADTSSKSGGGAVTDPMTLVRAERAKLVSAEAKVNILQSQLDELDKVAIAISSSGNQITSLERRKDAEEERLLYFENSLEMARIDEALDPKMIPNISTVQEPSLAEEADTPSMMKKIMLALAAGGAGFGVALALLIEMLLRRRVQRPVEIERRLGMGLMLSIPFLGKPNQRNNPLLLETGPADYRLRPYAKTIRDRLCYLFDAQNIVHQPKLIALTGLTKGAGTSSLAAALAASFSENGNQRVLLVDMSVEPGDKPLIGKKEIQFKEVKDNLYLASTRYGEEEEMHSSRITTNRLYELLPKFKASDFGYIIFDLPPFSPTSMTMFMDNVLLVCDAENTHQDFLTRAYGELLKGNHNVSCVFNKAAPKAPQWLCGAS